MRANQIKVGSSYEGAGVKRGETSIRTVNNIVKGPHAKYGDGIVEWSDTQGNEGRMALWGFKAWAKRIVET